MVDLKNKLAVVSGGARDIGRAVSIQLAKCGAVGGVLLPGERRASSRNRGSRTPSGSQGACRQGGREKRAAVEAFISTVRKSSAAHRHSGERCGRTLRAEDHR